MRVPLWPTVTTTVCFLILCSLGVWQLQRLQWKTELIVKREAQLHSPPVELDGIPLEAVLPGLDYRPVRLSGRFMNMGRLHMPSRVYNGMVGWHVLEYFEQNTGRIWLINRGWVPQDKLQNIPPTPTDEVTLTGLARAPQPPGRFTPANDPAHNLWYYYAPKAMFAAAEIQAPPVLDAFLARSEPGYVIETDKSGALPIGGATLTELPNNHLHYALTWFALAATLLGVYGFYLRSRQQD